MKFFLGIFVMVALSQSAYGQINNKKFLQEIFDGCLDEAEEGYAIGNYFGYCGCATANVARVMTMEEALAVGVNMLEAGKERELEILLANEKMKNAVVECASELYK